MGRALKTLAVGLAVGAVAALGAGVAGAAMGDLDPGFSGDGKLVQDVTQGGAEDVVTDSENRILIAADVDGPGVDTGDFAVARYLPNGALDPSFAGDGILTLNLAGGTAGDHANAIALDSQGRVVVGGSSGEASTAQTAVVRLTTAGAPDPSFGGGDGIFLQDFDGANADFVDDLVVDSADRIVATGPLGAATRNALTLRLTSQGTLDPGFSAPDGFDSLNVNTVSSDDASRGVAIDSLGRIVIAGVTDITQGEENFFAARYLTGGTLDTSFATNPLIAGRSITDASAGVAPNQSDGAEALAIAAGDRPLLAGFAETTGADMAVLQLTTGGTRDASFGGNGVASVDFGGTEFANGIAIDGAGRPVIAGAVDIGPAEFVVARFLTSGNPDTSFSGDGKTNTDVGPANDFAESVAIDRGGRIVAAGATATMFSDWALARYEGVPRCAGKIPTLTGTPGKDKLKGTKRKDVISGGGGKDTISGLGKADTICGEAGKDRLLGGKGNDRLLGGKGNDTLIGGPGGKDRLKGGKGKDVQRQ